MSAEHAAFVPRTLQIILVYVLISVEITPRISRLRDPPPWLVLHDIEKEALSKQRKGIQYYK